MTVYTVHSDTERLACGVQLDCLSVVTRVSLAVHCEQDVRDFDILV